MDEVVFVLEEKRQTKHWTHTMTDLPSFEGKTYSGKRNSQCDLSTREDYRSIRILHSHHAECAPEE